MAWEKQIKGWSRAKKEALIRGDFDALVELSKSKSKSHRACRSAKVTCETVILRQAQDGKFLSSCYAWRSANITYKNVFLRSQPPPLYRGGQAQDDFYFKSNRRTEPLEVRKQAIKHRSSISSGQHIRIVSLSLSKRVSNL
jgi:hypothetical protein